MSALTEADNEELADTLLAARARIEHLEAENKRLRKPKTSEEMLSWCPHPDGSTARTIWIDGFRCAEQSHGITGEGN